MHELLSFVKFSEKLIIKRCSIYVQLSAGHCIINFRMNKPQLLKYIDVNRMSTAMMFYNISLVCALT